MHNFNKELAVNQIREFLGELTDDNYDHLAQIFKDGVVNFSAVKSLESGGCNLLYPCILASLLSKEEVFFSKQFEGVSHRFSGSSFLLDKCRIESSDENKQEFRRVFSEELLTNHQVVGKMQKYGIGIQAESAEQAFLNDERAI